MLLAGAGGLGWRAAQRARERSGWVADYELLMRELPAGYANLEDRRQSRHLDLGSLDERARRELGQARDRDEALRALRRFTEAFDDGHLRLEVSPAGSAREAPLPAGLSGAEACARLGAPNRPLSNPWAAVAGYRAMGGDTEERPFQAGILAPEGGAPPLGVLRVPRFGHEAYPAVCAAAWERRRAAKGGGCDDACVDDFLLALEDTLTERLTAELEELGRAGARALLVDLTGNPGGSSVAGPWARELTSVPLRSPRQGVIRHPHWARRFVVHLRAFERDLARASLSPEVRALLLDARDKAARFGREAGEPCPAASSPGPTGGPPCERIIAGLFADGYLDYARPGLLDGLDSKGYLFQPSQYRYREGVWRAPLFILVDRRTSSAAEYVAATLRDNDAARLLGERTDGSGCGYTNGGVRVDLPHLGVRARMPDCIRYRRDGASEAEGITPDIPVPWQPGDDAPTRAKRALDVLPRSALR